MLILEMQTLMQEVSESKLYLALQEMSHFVERKIKRKIKCTVLLTGTKAIEIYHLTALERKSTKHLVLSGRNRTKTMDSGFFLHIIKKVSDKWSRIQNAEGL